MNFEDYAMDEVAAAILSITGPYIDLSNPENLYEQEMELSKYADLPDEDFPMAVVYTDGEVMEQVANDRCEIALSIDLSLVYKIDPPEKKSDGLERGRRCLRQIIEKIQERQQSGEALTQMYYPNDGISITATSNRGTGHKETDPITAVATAKFTLRHIEQKEQSNG